MLEPAISYRGGNMAKAKSIVSAQVILPPAQGKLDGNTQVTSENVQSFAPAPERVAKARKEFEEAGFETSDLYGISFSITGSVKLFEDFFKVKLEEDKPKGVYVATRGETQYELPLKNLPENLQDLITTVTFSPPPDFGPTGSFN
jgi:hypothetical protein